MGGPILTPVWEESNPNLRGDMGKLRFQLSVLETHKCNFLSIGIMAEVHTDDA